MEYKKCKGCLEEKTLDCYTKASYGYISRCKICKSIELTEWRRKNKEKVSFQNKRSRDKNGEKIYIRAKKFRENNRELVNESARKSYHKYAEQRRKKMLDYHLKNRDKLRVYSRNYYAIRLKNDPFFKLKKILRSRIREGFLAKGVKKAKKSEEVLGVSFEIAKLHIERQFKKGMTWQNHGEWHVDHIIPLASAKTEEDIYKLCHYTNLQPLWAKENMDKKAKIITAQIKLTL